MNPSTDHFLRKFYNNIKIKIFSINNYFDTMAYVINASYHQLIGIEDPILFNNYINSIIDRIPYSNSDTADKMKKIREIAISYCVEKTNLLFSMQ